MFDLVEHLALLISPHPKETQKAIQFRRDSMKEKEDIKSDTEISRVITKGGKNYLSGKNVNPNFEEDIAAYAGKGAVKEIFGENRVTQIGEKSFEKVNIDDEDLKLIQQINDISKEYEEDITTPTPSTIDIDDADSIIF